ncbi:hypothetical protein K2173_019534 [Erythroxylum novogranatense]|uniref:Integral membrane bound transporter domain-containing protein n=1 Tax=Erythroxylum novogranatense TaxID=1862640 RepID=A0AAV8UG88_9ROSI|nr:hypothetical protein K2173_019534 [Erythroxylum novogranatense]
MSTTATSIWLVRFMSALRSALACLIVASTTLYGPASIRLLIPYPAFAYTTAIQIVSDATLGDSLRGCWYAVCATIQTTIPCTLTLWMVGPDKFTTGLAAAAVAITSFIVALPDSTPMASKRIAFGQIVILYVDAVVNGSDQKGVFMHPIHIACSTALGALASVLAMLVPYPRLAYYEARRACYLYMENASERLELLVKAFVAKDKQAATDLISQAKLLTQTGVRNLQDVIDCQSSLVWELCNSKLTNPGENLQNIETKLRGLEIALSCQSLPVGMNDEGLMEELLKMKDTGLKLSQAKSFGPFGLETTPDTTETSSKTFLWTPKTNARTLHDLSIFFFLYCIQHLQSDSPIGTCPEPISENTGKVNTHEAKDQTKRRIVKTWNSLVQLGSGERWTFALKCSLSLGFAVLLGLMFEKDQGYWSGLTTAICFVNGRQALFSLANACVQGTALGSIYGIICCFVFQHFMDLKILPLLPWVMLTSFLRHSKMYGKAGATAAATGAFYILGRTNYGEPSEFGIARLTEVSIGLICFIVLEVASQPVRAATIAKTGLAWSLGALRICVEDISVCGGQKMIQFRDRQKILKWHVNNLERFIADAEVEPNFWFVPFNGASYKKLLGSLRKMTDLLLFTAYEIENILAESERLGLDKKKLGETLNGDLDHFRRKVVCSLESFEEVILTKVKSISEPEAKLQMEKVHYDVEAGKSHHEAEVEEIVESFLQRSMEVFKELDNCKAEQKSENQMILCLTSLAFCIDRVNKETIEIEKELKNLIIWEDPSKAYPQGKHST